ncbi:MAG: MFS transporter [Anaerolineales bacterium]|nr:MAG: MFS transporter [Anaerolineales bacterium]
MASHFPALNISGSLRALRHRNFRLFFWGQLISVIGVWMQSTAQQWLVYRITGSQTSLGMVTFINFLPVLLLSLFMGVVVDQYSRRKILIITQSWFMVLAIVLAILTWLDLIEYWQILLLSFLLGIGSALDMPARQAFVVEMVDDDKNDLMNAIGLNSSLFNIARIIGPAIGGLIVAALGEAPTFAINGLSYLAVIMALLLMRVSPPKNKDAAERPRKRMQAGFSYIAGEKSILGLVIMVAVFSMIGFGALTLVPVFAKDILQIGVKGFGQLLSWQGVGALAGGVLLIFFGDHFHKGKLLLFSRFLLGPGILGLALSKTPWFSMAIMALVGYSFITQLVITNTLIQTIVPDDLRGRVISTYTWAMGGFYPLGSLLMGFLGDRWGAPAAGLISGIGCILVLMINVAVFPSIHKLN